MASKAAIRVVSNVELAVHDFGPILDLVDHVVRLLWLVRALEAQLRLEQCSVGVFTAAFVGSLRYSSVVVNLSDWVDKIHDLDQLLLTLVFLYESQNCIFDAR